MKIHTKLLVCFIGFLGFLGCDNTPKDPYYDSHNTPTTRFMHYNHETQTGRIITYYESGKKASACYYDKGRRDSLYRSWHENGKPQLEIWYNKGKKDGLYQRFREDGSLYREIEYKNNDKHGQYQEFWKNGNLKYALTYDRDMPINNSIREFKSTGSLKKDSYLVIKEYNTVQTNGKYKLYVYFEDLPPEAYYSAVIDGVPYILDMENNKGVIKLDVPKGVFVMKKVQFEGYYQGRKKTIKSVRRSFNLGIENL